jgi:hypothetical protein
MPSQIVNKEAFEQEFLAGGPNPTLAMLQAVQSVSSFYLDSVTGQFGVTIYQEMLKDEDVWAAYETRKLSVISEGMRVQPAAGADKKNPDDIKNVYAKFVERSLAGCENDLTDVSYDLLDALSTGSKIAEQVFKFGTGQDAGRLVHDTIQCKQQRLYSYVYNRRGQILGVTAPIYTDNYQKQLLEEFKTGELKNYWQWVVPREKLIHYVNDPKDGSFIGTPCLKAAYTMWFLKTKLVPEYFKYLSLFATPSVVGTLPTLQDDPTGLNPLENILDPTATQVNSSTATEQDSKAKVLLNELLKWRNAYALVVKGGTKIDFFKADGDGSAFRNALDYFGRQITQAILGSAQATVEAKHESRSAKEVAQDVVGLRVANDRRRLSNCLTRDVAHTVIRMNFGDEAVQHAPSIVLTRLEQQDRTEAIKTYGMAYAQGFLKDVQLPDLYDETGLPALPEGYLEEQQFNAEQAAKERAKLIKPEANPKDPNVGTD